MHVLRLNYGDFTVSNFENFKLMNKDWEYLNAFHEILGAFYVTTMELQKWHHLTNSETIPTIFALLKKSESLKNTDASRENSLIAYGLDKARKKVLEYYPSNNDSIASNKILYLAFELDSRYN